MEMVKLKNGAQEVEGVVRAVMMSLRGLREEAPLVFYDLVMMCRERGYKAWSNMKPAQDLNLIGPDGRIHDTIRHTVLSAVIGDGLAMTIGDPIATEAPPCRVHIEPTEAGLPAVKFVPD